MAKVFRIIVEMPISVSEETRDHIFTAVADAADAAEPDDREGWDVFIYAGPADDA